MKILNSITLTTFFICLLGGESTDLDATCSNTEGWVEFFSLLFPEDDAIDFLNLTAGNRTILGCDDSEVTCFDMGKQIVNGTIESFEFLKDKASYHCCKCKNECCGRCNVPMDGSVTCGAPPTPPLSFTAAPAPNSAPTDPLSGTCFCESKKYYKGRPSTDLYVKENCKGNCDDCCREGAGLALLALLVIILPVGVAVWYFRKKRSEQSYETANTATVPQSSPAQVETPEPLATAVPIVPVVVPSTNASSDNATHDDPEITVLPTK